MKDLALAPRSTFANVRFVLTDMDETLTYRGRLSARTYPCVGAASGRGSESNSRDGSASGLVRSDGSDVAGRRRDQREWWPIHTTRW